MEQYHHQLYRRPQMTGQASEEEDINRISKHFIIIIIIIGQAQFLVHGRRHQHAASKLT